MSKKILTISLTLVIVFGTFTTTASAAGLTAAPTASKVLVNSKDTSFDAYNINGNNYFKLRDLAYVLKGTAKQFEIGWDGTKNAISLTSGKAYTAVGGEMTGKGAGNKTAAPTSSKIFLDGKEVKFTAYNIEGNNYFKLRDVGEAFNFGVDWDGAQNTIVIDTSKGYTPEGGGTANPDNAKPDEPKTPPSGGVDKSLIGIWVDDPNRSLAGQYRSLQFNENGTFISVWSQYFQSGTLKMQSAKITQTGNYRVSNGTIITSNVKEAYEGKVSGADPDYQNKSVDLPVMEYKLSEIDLSYYNEYYDGDPIYGDFIHIANVRYSGDEIHQYTRLR